MATMDILCGKIVQQIEAYLIDENLKLDYARDNEGWIRLELLIRSARLSSSNYETVLRALCSKQSNLIELSSFEPRCVRRRGQPSLEQRTHDAQTVVVTGLPTDIRYEELIAFFNRFYPVRDMIKISPSSERSEEKLHVIFNKSTDALAFVQQSKSITTNYTNGHLLQTTNGYPIVCQMLNNQSKSMPKKSFSTRLANASSRGSSTNNPSVQQNFCLKSNTCATEQILFCQNIPDDKSNKILDNDKQKIVRNQFSYEFRTSDDLRTQIHQCVMMSVLNPFCFTVLLQRDVLEFDQFQREINDFYNTINDKRYFLTPEQIKSSLCVICADPKSPAEKKIWNRSQILDFDPVDNTVNLFYIDLGTWDEHVPIDRLRHLTDDFHRHVVSSITCRLAHICPRNDENDSITWTDEGTHQFLAVLEQNVPEIEFLAMNSDGCFETNLFVINSDQYVCVNDYLIHIRKAKAIESNNHLDDDGQNSIQSDEHDLNGNGSPIHPVIALYNRLGEVLQQSPPASISSSAVSSPSGSPRLFVKLIHVNTGNDRAYSLEEQLIPLIFVQYEKSILIPDFNIVTILKLINPSFDIQTIEHYAFNIRYTCVNINQESNFHIFAQLSSLIDIPYSDSIALYPLDFVDYILKHYRFRVANVFVTLDDARHAQLNTSDLAFWFTIDNELKYPIAPSIPQQSSILYRLPFSNRLINPI